MDVIMDGLFHNRYVFQIIVLYNWNEYNFIYQFISKKLGWN